MGSRKSGSVSPAQVTSGSTPMTGWRDVPSLCVAIAKQGPTRGGETYSQGTAFLFLSYVGWSVLTGLSLPLTEGRSEFTLRQLLPQA